MYSDDRRLFGTPTFCPSQQVKHFSWVEMIEVASIRSKSFSMRYSDFCSRNVSKRGFNNSNACVPCRREKLFDFTILEYSIVDVTLKNSSVTSLNFWFEILNDSNEGIKSAMVWYVG